MEWFHQLYSWPTCIWTGMISLVAVTLTVLTLTDNMKCPEWLVPSKKKPKKKGKR